MRVGASDQWAIVTLRSSCVVIPTIHSLSHWSISIFSTQQCVWCMRDNFMLDTKNKHLNYEILMFSGKSSNQPGYRIQMTSCLSGTQLVLFSPDLFKNGSKYLFQTKSISFTAKTLPQILEFLYLPRDFILFYKQVFICVTPYLHLPPSNIKTKKLINVLYPVMPLMMHPH